MYFDSRQREEMQGRYLRVRVWRERYAERMAARRRMDEERRKMVR